MVHHGEGTVPPTVGPMVVGGVQVGGAQVGGALVDGEEVVARGEAVDPVPEPLQVRHNTPAHFISQNFACDD